MPLALGPFGPVRIRGAGTAFPARTLTNEAVLALVAPHLWPDREPPAGERLAFLARGLSAVGQDLQDDESITVSPTPIDQCFDMIDRGDITDAKSMLALLLARRRGLI